MKVQTKIILLLLAVVAIFGGGLALIKHREHAKFREIARERSEERIRSWTQFLDRQGEPLETLAKDFTNWNDMVNAIAENNLPWCDQTINDATLDKFGAQAVWIYHPNRTLFVSKNRLYLDSELHEVPLPPAVFDKVDHDRLMHFFMPVSLGIMEVRAATVHPSSDGFRQTPPQGYFFAARLWNSDLIKNFSRDSNNLVRLVSTSSPLAEETEDADNGIVTFSSPLLGWDGKTIARVLVSNDSATIKELNRSSDQLMVWLVIFALVLVLILSISLVRWVTRPLRMISQALTGENLAPIEGLRTDKSEFGGLAQLIREFFEQRSSLIAEINERKSAQEALRESGEQLRQAQKMEAIGRLAGGVAHDFNNLLTAILGYAELLSGRRDLDPSSRQNVDMIQKAGRQAAAVTHQLLAFSRKQLLQPEIIDLAALVSDFEQILHRVIGEHIELKTCAGTGKARVKADPNQIEQVILNLGVNARDAMAKGGRLTIQTFNVQLDEAAARACAPDLSAGSYVVMEVHDTGHGMSAEVKSRIFEPFFTTKGPGKGTGLGLATVYGIIKQSGGAISVESAVGVGTTFRIYLPSETAPLDEAKPKTVAPIDEHANRAETILVVEDEEIVRELVCQVLVAQGYRVLCASQGAEAMRLSAEHDGEIRLLITDVIMPLMGGLELARKLTAERPQTRVLYVSGYSEDDMSEHGIMDANLEFLEKPFTPQALARKVREVLYPFETQEADAGVRIHPSGMRAEAGNPAVSE